MRVTSRFPFNYSIGVMGTVDDGICTAFHLATWAAFGVWVGHLRSDFVTRAIV